MEKNIKPTENKVCKVLSYNKFSNIAVIEKDGKKIQTVLRNYDGKGYVRI